MFFLEEAAAAVVRGQRAVRCRGAGAVTHGPSTSPLCFSTALGSLVQMGLSPDLPPAAELLLWQSTARRAPKPLRGRVAFLHWPFPPRSRSWVVATQPPPKEASAGLHTA